MAGEDRAGGMTGGMTGGKTFLREFLFVRKQRDPRYPFNVNVLY